ncbi:MAG: DUF255 domain-containing protein [Thermoanaerobaculia bacterium]
MAVLSLAGSALATEPAVRWENWSDGAFARAQAERRLVLLDLGAVWCHWCHVMEETTYKDPRVTELLREHFVAIRVDQDSRPDLSNRYEDYGWPATVVFDAEGNELVKFAGYIPPPRMAALLEAVVEDPTPGPSIRPLTPDPSVLTPDPSPRGRGENAGTVLPEPLRKDLRALLVQRYDRQVHGWGFSKKYLDWDSVEYCLVRARAGDADAKRMAKQTLAAARKLIDPVWGGLYQYSDRGDWDHPHFEKLLQFQAEGIRIYAQAYALWHDSADLQAARDIHRYVRAFLTSPEGAFCVSQDADLVPGEHSGEYYALDDAGRRRLGIPRVDTHLYARETAWMVPGLVWLYAATKEGAPFAEALIAGDWLVAHRALPGGGFRHDAKDAAGPYLGDTIAAGRAFLALYAATGDRAWLSRAQSAADFIGKTFAGEAHGLVSAVSRDRFAAPRPQRDENVAVARFANLLFHYTGRESDRRLADRAMGYLVAPAVAERFSTASVLLADAERASEPAHLTVVGPRQDLRARALLAAALSEPSLYKRVELWDRREGPLPNLDVEFPDLERPAAFVCSNGRCSLPAFEPKDLLARAARLNTLAAVSP